MNRVCSICKIEKDINLFEADKRKPHGKAYKCKECRNKRDRKRNKIKRTNDKEWRDRYNKYHSNYKNKNKKTWQQKRYQDKFNKAVENNAQSSIYIRKCNDCGKYDVLRKEPEVNKCYCRRCYYKYRTLGSSINKITIIKCIDCSVNFNSLNGRIRCKRCKLIHLRKLRRLYRSIHGSRSTHRKRAKYFGVFYEPISRKKVFDRDDWQCNICGIDVIKEPLKYNSGELDHIVPISKGGSHSYLNVQCLCRRCNNLKGDNIYTEYIL